MTGRVQMPRPPGRTPIIGTLAWVALIGTVGALAFLALTACGISWPGGDRPVLWFCAEPATAAQPDTMLLAERARSRDLQQRLDTLTLALMDAPECEQPEPPLQIVEPIEDDPDEPIVVAEAPRIVEGIDIDERTVDVPEVVVPDEDLIDEAVADENALDQVPEPPMPEEQTEVPEPPQIPEDNAVQPPEPPMPEEVANLPPEDQAVPDPNAEDEQIGEEDWDEQDISLLDGCWDLATNYSITRTDTGEVFNTENWQMCFDENGYGTQRLAFDEGGLVCEGDVRAQFGQNGQLIVVDQGNVPCNNGTAIDRRILNCQRLPDGTAACETRHTTPPASPMPVRFRRP